MLRTLVQRSIQARPAASAAGVRLLSSNIPDAGGAYRERELTAEKEYALKRDKEALAKLRAQLLAEEAKAAQKHGAEALDLQPAARPVPEVRREPALAASHQPTSQPIDQPLSHRSQFRHDPAAGSFISLSEFLEFRKEIFTKLREVEDEVIALKYQLKKK